MKSKVSIVINHDNEVLYHAIDIIYSICLQCQFFSNSYSWNMCYFNANKSVLLSGIAELIVSVAYVHISYEGGGVEGCMLFMLLLSCHVLKCD